MSRQDYQRVEQAIHFIEDNLPDQPSLGEISASVGLSEYHFQRLFRRWAGVSPKRFLEYLTAGQARRLLENSRSVLDAAFEVGLSGPSRLHDLTINIYAATPGELKRRGAGLDILFGVHSSPFGDCLLARTERGICWLSFLGPVGREEAVEELKKEWPAALLREDQAATRPLAERIFGPGAGGSPLSLFVRGTNFQIKVWEALLRIPPGAAVSYRDLAARIGSPGAARAVGRAVATNPVAFLIPCHRVLRQSGAFAGYRWGLARKKALLGWEAARREAGPGPAQARSMG